MRITSSIFLVVLAASATAARAQFGSGIVYDPTQSAHAVQQILQAKQLYTTTVQTEQKVIAAYNLARQMANLPAVSLHIVYQSRPSAVDDCSPSLPIPMAIRPNGSMPP